MEFPKFTKIFSLQELIQILNGTILEDNDQIMQL